jgi:hypothetical protein
MVIELLVDSKMASNKIQNGKLIRVTELSLFS